MSGQNTLSGRCRSPIFILGTMRSGTTLMRLILDRHEHIAVGPESGFMRAVRGIKKVPDWNFGDRWYERFDLDEEEMNRRIASFYGGIFERYAAHRGKRRWGEKTPFHRLAMAEMAEIFPRALFLVMVRHAAAVAMSLKGWKYPLQESLEDWVRSNRKMRRVTGILDRDQAAPGRAGLGRVLWCRYEDLVAHPEETTRAVMRFLDEPWSEDLLRPDQAEAEREAVVEGGTRRDDPIDRERIDRWRLAISPREMALVRRLAGEMLGEFGYRVETAVPARELDF